MNQQQFSAMRAVVVDTVAHFGEMSEAEAADCVKALNAAEITEQFYIDRDTWVRGPRWSRCPIVTAIYRQHGMA